MLDNLLGLGVEGRGCFIKEEDWEDAGKKRSAPEMGTFEARRRTLRIPDESTSDGDTLFLASTELSSLACGEGGLSGTERAEWREVTSRTSNLGVVAVGQRHDKVVNAEARDAVRHFESGASQGSYSLGVLACPLNFLPSDLLGGDVCTKSDVERYRARVQRLQRQGPSGFALGVSENGTEEPTGS